MKITDALKGEHGVFYAQFSFIEEQLAKASLSTTKSLGAMLASALAPHAHIENDVLFPAIEEKIGAGGPTTVMRHEHIQIEGMLEQLSEFASAHDEIEGSLAQLPKANDAEQARRLMQDVLLAARNHFAKEENVLFPMADQMLDESALGKLGMEWASRRGVVLA